MSELSELIHIVALATDANPDRGRLDLRCLSRGETRLLLKTLKALEGIEDPEAMVKSFRAVIKGWDTFDGQRMSVPGEELWLPQQVVKMASYIVTAAKTLNGSK